MRRVLLPHAFSDQPLPAAAKLWQLSGLSMGTSWSVRLCAAHLPPRLQAGIQAQLDAVVADMSHWQEDSALSQFNRAAPGAWQALSVPFFDVLRFALAVQQSSAGAYDPGAGALVNAWGFGARQRVDQAGFVAPSPAALAALRASAEPITLELHTRSARQPGGVLLDLSAVAKGYGVDAVALLLAAQGIEHFLVEVGGELRGAGIKPDGQPWWVALEQVGDAASGAQAGQMVLALHGLAVATSGDYRRYFTQGAQRYSHTIDPRSGAPIANDIASVTVVAASCMAADAWSTALTVLGLTEGMALAERLGLAARFLQRTPGGLTEHLSSHLRGMLEA